LTRRAAVISVLPLVVLLSVMAGRDISLGGIVTSDTIGVLHGVAAVDSCLRRGDFSCVDFVDKWPLLQYIPGLALKRLGFSFMDAEQGLVLISGAAVLGVVALLWLAGERARAGLGPLAAIAMLVSPLPWYAATGYGEPLAAFLIALMVAAIAFRWHPSLAAVGCFGAIISKETALPFVLALATAALLLPGVDADRRRRLIVALAAGAAAGLAATVMFNVFRYGVPWNREYLRPGYALHGTLWRLDFFGAEFAAPNAGLVFFWPLAAAALVCATVAAGRNAVRRRTVGEDRVVLLVGATLLLQCAALASWWQPFGWEAYGPRLIVPWIPAMLLIVLLAAPGLVRLLRRAVAPLPGALAVGAALLVLGLPQLGAFLSPVVPIASFRTDTNCPPVRDFVARIRANEPVAHRVHNECTSRFAWQHRPVMIATAKTFRGSRWIVAALLAASIAAALAVARRSLLTPGQIRRGGHGPSSERRAAPSAQAL
jgi:hypothetical protein